MGQLGPPPPAGPLRRGPSIELQWLVRGIFLCDRIARLADSRDDGATSSSSGMEHGAPVSRGTQHGNGRLPIAPLKSTPTVYPQQPRGSANGARGVHACEPLD